MALAVLSVDLVAKLASLEAGFDKSYRLAERNARNIEARYQRIGATFKAIGSTIGASFAGVSLVRVFAGVVDGIDRLNDLKDATGSSIENLSALEDVARRNGGTFETVSATLLKFQQILRDAKPGSQQAEILKSIGLNAEELKRIDPAEALRQVASAFNGLADDERKALLMQELFGRSTREVAAYLKDLGEQSKLVATVTSDQADQAERFNKQLAAMSRNAENVGRAYANELLPKLNDYFEMLQRIQRSGGFKAAIGEIGQEIDANLISDRLRVVVAEIERLDEYMQKNPGSRPLEMRMAQLRDEAAKLTKQALAASDALKGFAGQASPLPVPESLKDTRGGPGLLAPDIPDPTRRPGRGGSAARREIVTETRAMSDALRALEQTDVAKIAAIEATLTELFTLQRETRGAPAVVESIRRLYDELEKLQSTRGPAILDPREQIKNDFLRSEKGAYETLDKLDEKLEKTKGFADDLGWTFSSAFEDAIVGGEKLSDVLKGLEQDILRIVTRKLVTEPLGNAITGLLQGATSGGGGFLSSLFAGFFATGGYIPPGQWGIAGERGPEPVYGGRTGLTVQPSAQRGAPVTINVNVPQGTSRASAMQIGARAMSELQRAQRNM